jgi:hypothetical protein
MVLKIHTPHATLGVALRSSEVEVMDCPSEIGPDLNPIVPWAILSQLVYAGNRQYRTKSALKVWD